MRSDSAIVVLYINKIKCPFRTKHFDDHTEKSIAQVVINNQKYFIFYYYNYIYCIFYKTLILGTYLIIYYLFFDLLRGSKHIFSLIYKTIYLIIKSLLYLCYLKIKVYIVVNIINILFKSISL